MNLRREDGYTMVAVMAVVVIISTIVIAVATLSLSDIRQGQIWRDKTAAFYMAESGINDALYRIQEKADMPPVKVYPNYPASGTSQNRYDFGPGKSFEYWVTQTGSTLKIISRGKSNKFTKVVEQNMNLPSVFPRNIIETKVGEDFYDPNYVSPVIQITMPAGANEGLLDDRSNTTLTGSHYFSAIEMKNNKMLDITGPAVINVAGDMRVNNGSNLVTHGDVTINIAGNLFFDQNSNLFSNNGKVVFNVGKNATMEANYMGNTQGNSDPLKQDPTNLVIYLSTAPAPMTYTAFVHMDCNFVGGICGPKAYVDIFQNNKLDAVVGYVVNIHVQGDVQYDPRMGWITYPGVSNWGLTGWSER